MAQKEIELKATLEILDADEHEVEGHVDDDSPNRRQLKLTPEQIAALESEKALLLGSLRGAVPDRPVPTMPPTVSDEPVIVPSSPALQAAVAAAEEADAELAALEQEHKDLQRQRAEALKAEEAAHKARLAALNHKRSAAEAEARRLRQVQSGIELAARVQIQEQEAIRERERQQASANEQRAALAARVQPLLDQAVAVRADLHSLAQHRPTLEKLSRISWQQTPSAWPNELRIEYNNMIPSTAEKILGDLNRSLQSSARLIAEAERIVAGDVTDGQTIEQTLWEIGHHNSDLIRSFREQIAALNELLNSIQGRGEHARPGQAPLEPRPVADGLSPKERAIRALGIQPGEAVDSRLLGEDDGPVRKQQPHAAGSPSGV